MSRGVSRRTLASPEHRAQRNARPLGHADAAEAPLRARGHLAHELVEEGPPVAGTLDEGGDGARGQAQEVVEAELDGTLDAVALDSQPPRAARRWPAYGRVLADEEVAGRGQVASERLEPGLLVDPVVDEDVARHGLDVQLRVGAGAWAAASRLVARASAQRRR